jgi:hypothetical protein
MLNCVLPPFLYDGCSGSVFMRETQFSRDNHLGTEGVHQMYNNNIKELLSIEFIHNYIS